MDGFVSSLLHFNGADTSTVFTDETGKTWTAQGNAQLDTAQKKFGTASLLLDGTLDYITTPTHNDFNLGGGDFTIDFQIRFNALPLLNNNKALVHRVHTDDSGYQINVYDDAGVHSLDFRNFTGVAYSIDIKRTISTLLANTWYHIEIDRSGSNFYFFLDGVQQSTTGVDADPTTDNVGTLYLGANRVGDQSCDGWIDEFRMSKGVARHTANFTPPTEEYALAGGVDIIVPQSSVSIGKRYKTVDY